MEKQLPEDIYQRMTSLCKEGEMLVNAGALDSGKQKYVEALRLLPSDPTQWKAATWIYVAIGDVHFKLGNFEKSLKCFSNAVQCPDGLGNPFIHLRLGQACFEQMLLDRAAEELTRAYMGGGLDILLEDDPKYLEFLETKIDI